MSFNPMFRMNKIDVVLGFQWGDEGKGKVVDCLTPDYKAVARFQGGPNAGHSISIGGRSHVLHTVPSGIFREGVLNIIGNGVVVDPVILQDEISKIEALGIDITGRLIISKRAHLILPTHRALDAASEASKGKAKIGSTLKGIGPCYMDKIGRVGIKVGDLGSASATYSSPNSSRSIWPSSRSTSSCSRTTRTSRCSIPTTTSRSGSRP